MKCQVLYEVPGPLRGAGGRGEWQDGGSMSGGQDGNMTVLGGYGSSRSFRLGVEEELLLVDPVVHDLDPCCDRVLVRASFSAGHASGEFSQSVLELVTPICEDAGEAIRRLRALRADAVAA